MPRSLVTGGAGFIGSHLVEGLLARGDSVRILHRHPVNHRHDVPSETRGVRTGEQ